MKSYPHVRKWALFSCGGEEACANLDANPQANGLEIIITTY